jgi:hypothetical protein
MSNLSPLAITLHQCHAVGGWERVAAEVEGMVATWRTVRLKCAIGMRKDTDIAL